jgi:hypothetical protein
MVVATGLFSPFASKLLAGDRMDRRHAVEACRTRCRSVSCPLGNLGVPIPHALIVGHSRTVSDSDVKETLPFNFHTKENTFVA